MRPIKLTISAFGPYSEKTVFDMSKFGNKGIYLISGDTGSGKTTIFDAICYALYGVASGEVRDASMFRSKYASLDVDTYVELLFDYGGEEYLVKRNPEYERVKKRGEGFTKENANAELTLPDGSIITKTKSVNDKIYEVLGVDREQFSQIAMISQGEFLKLIISDTKDREKIFREIFKTSYYGRLESDVKAKKSELEKSFERVTESINQYKDNILCENIDFSQITDRDETLKELNKLIEKAQDEKNAIVKTLESIDSDIILLNTKLSKKKSYDTLKAELVNLKNDFNEKNKELEKVNEKISILETKKLDFKDKENLITEIEHTLKDYDDFDEIESYIAEKETQNNKILNDLAIKKNEFIALSEDISKSEITLNNIGDVSVDLFKLESLIEKKDTEILEKKEKLNSVSKIQKVALKLEDIKKDYEKAKLEYDNAETIWKNYYISYIDNQAGLLAKDLKAGEPCLVCGSTLHPKKAEFKDTDISKDGLDLKEKTKNQKMRSFEVKKDSLLSVNAELDTLYENLQLDKQSVDIDRVYDDLSSLIYGLESKLKEIILDKESKLKLISEKSKLEQKLKNFRESVEILESESKDLELKLAEISSAIKAKKDEKDKVKSKLKFDSKKDAEKRLFDLKSELFKLDNEIKTLKDLKDNFKSETESISGRIIEKEHLISKNANFKSILLSDLTLQLDLKMGEKKNIELEREKISSTLNTNQNIYKSLLKLLNEYSHIEKNYNVVKSISDTLSGNIKGKDKITIETYVQTHYFDRVIERANLRLLNMSNGQYELKRADSSSNLSKKSGLDLDVIDHYNSSVRSVKTLSGGELFKASLSLALGLSDEVQESIGGIRLDTMFIDEGFGTLDEDSLNKAIKTLINLSNDNRLIGIISHVSDLKEKIDKKIIVTKNRDSGSNVSFEY